jgi:predicted component of type VI protein secretion system
VPDRPCGEDLAFSSESTPSCARARPTTRRWSRAPGSPTLKEADWKFVGKQCAQLIEKRSKDLQLAVWLAEAEAKDRRPARPGDSLLLVAACASATGTACIRCRTRTARARIGNLAGWPRASRRCCARCR